MQLVVNCKKKEKEDTLKISEQDLALNRLEIRADCTYEDLTPRFQSWQTVWTDLKLPPPQLPEVQESFKN